ncbi:MAG: LysM peptidoglycan-binding domain-containing protein, partial [Caldilineales bacterium]|nr:LysM peptidoglycan-binding domain-containing protein [Caldilineales bacterium]
MIVFFLQCREMGGMKRAWVPALILAALLLSGCNWRQQAVQIVKTGTDAPASPSATPTPLPPPPTPTPDLRPRHIVQSGDTAWAIAARYGVSLEQLSAANRLFDASALEVGAELVIPITPTATPTPTPDPAATPTPTPTPLPTDAAPTRTPTPT